VLLCRASWLPTLLSLNGDVGGSIKLRPITAVKLIALLNRQNKLKTPNKLARPMLPEVATGSLVHTLAGERHKDDGSGGAEKSFVSPIALKFGV